MDNLALARRLITEMLRVNVTASEAASTQNCKRKTVCSSIFHINEPHLVTLHYETNGPNEGHECRNIVGGCGCAHSEPRNTMWAILNGFWGMGMAINYSPCSFCANVMVDSKRYNLVVYDILTEHDKGGVDILRRTCTVLKLSDLQIAVRAWSTSGSWDVSGLSQALAKETARNVYDQLTEWEARRTSR